MDKCLKDLSNFAIDLYNKGHDRLRTNYFDQMFHKWYYRGYLFFLHDKILRMSKLNEEDQEPH